MRLQYFQVFLIFVLISCSSKKTSETFKQNDPNRLEPTYIVVDNKTESPISLNIERSFADKREAQFVSYKSSDTIEFSIDKQTLLLLDNKYIYRDSVVIAPGDTLYISLNNEGLDITASHQFELSLVSEDGSSSTSSDSIYKEFFTSLPDQAIDGHNDFSKVRLVPLEFHRDLYEKNKSRFKNLFYSELNNLGVSDNSMIDEIQTKNGEVQDLVQEVRRKKTFNRLSELYSFSKDRELLKALSSSEYFSDSNLVNSIFGSDYLYFYLKEVVLEGKTDRSRAKEYIDFKVAYNLIPEHFTGKLANIAKQVCLLQMMEYGENYEIIGSFLTHYQNNSNDSTFIDYFSEVFMRNYEALVNTKVDLNLLSEDGSTTTLSNILKQNEGKLLYIDYWASWCAPCRIVMPLSNALRKEYEDQDIVFVYLSTDKNQEKWKSAALSDGLSDYPHSYLVLNHQNSQFTAGLEIQSIPRYLLFDRKGKLVERNAPGPKGDELKEKFEYYLSK